MSLSDPLGRARTGGAEDTVHVAFRFHARALAALGRELVTNDVVAVMELVKNAYDALARQVTVRICSGVNGGDLPFIEVIDDGEGMDVATIRDVWCVIATPFRRERPISKSGRRSRTATGEKGLGRLSAARLGRKLSVTTRTRGGPAFRFSLNWDDFLEVDDLGNAAFEVSKEPDRAFGGAHGTRIRIDDLRGDWGEKEIEDLRHNLSRLVSPFSTVGDFSLNLDATSRGKGSTLKIEAPEFMSEPKYAIEGRVAADGTIRAEYRYRPVGGSVARKRTFAEKPVDDGRLDCGPFRFELRAWDLTKNDTRDIAEHFGTSKSQVRRTISLRNGISVYRDDVLVLPKSDGARDWLGLDVRRISRVGSRLGTSQIVGYVRITKKDNPHIVDTSDREGIVSNSATEGFGRLIRRIVALLEGERHVDRMDDKDKDTVRNLFAFLKAEPLVAKLENMRVSGGSMSDAVEEAKGFGRELERSRAAIERRFGYSSRLAVIGTVAQMIIHEIRNRTSIIGRGLRKIGQLRGRTEDAGVRRAFAMAKDSVAALEGLADRFAPLASRGYRRGRRTSVLEESIDRCLEMLKRQIGAARITVLTPSEGRTVVGVDPGEIDAVILNILGNAIYWLRRHGEQRQLRFRVTEDAAAGRVTLSVDDSGPGIEPGDHARVFWPGVTGKPDGIGMGLTVAAEIVDGHGGKTKSRVPGALGGATFEFDLPLARNRRQGAI